MPSIIAPISALLLSVAFLMVGHGIQMTIVPIRAEMEMFSSASIGFITSAFYVGFVGGTLLGPFLIVRSGHIRAFAAMISISSAAALAHPLLPDTVAWSLARGATGFCIACNYLIIESWLNERATNLTRGLVMSAYTVVVYASMMVGQFSTAWLDISGFDAFVISSIALSIAVVPVSLTRSAQPAPIAVVRFRPVRLYKTSPTAILSIIIDGFAVGALISLLPLYASRIGMDSKLIPFFAGGLMLGGLLLQYPLGRFSDKVDRRYMLIVGALGTTAVSLFIALTSISSPYMLIGLVVILGGLIQPLYAIAAAHAYDHGASDETVETAAGILLAYGIGSIFGPFVSSIAMDRFGPNALFLVVAFVLIFMVGFLVVRVLQRETPTSDQKADYDYAASAPVGGIIPPDLYEAANDYVLVPDEYTATNNDPQESKKDSA